MRPLESVSWYQSSVLVLDPWKALAGGLVGVFTDLLREKGPNLPFQSRGPSFMGNPGHRESLALRH